MPKRGQKEMGVVCVEGGLIIISLHYCFPPQGIMLVYDVTREKSFERISYWIREIEEVCLVRYHMTYHVVQRGEEGYGKVLYSL